MQLKLIHPTIEKIEGKLDKEIDSFIRTSKINVNSKQVTHEKFLEDKMLIVIAIRKGIPYSLFDLIQKYTPFSALSSPHFRRFAY